MSARTILNPPSNKTLNDLFNGTGYTNQNELILSYDETNYCTLTSADDGTLLVNGDPVGGGSSGDPNLPYINLGTTPNLALIKCNEPNQVLMEAVRIGTMGTGAVNVLLQANPDGVLQVGGEVNANAMQMTGTGGDTCILSCSDASDNLLVNGAPIVLSLTAGAGIDLSATTGNITITNTGGGGGGGIDTVNGGAGITAYTAAGVVDLANTGVLSLTAGAGINVDATTGDIVVENTGVLALTAGAGITITGTNSNKTITASGTNTFTDVIISSGGHTANLATNATNNLTVNADIVATQPYVASTYQPILGNTFTLNNYGAGFNTNTTVGYACGHNFENQTSPAIDGSAYYLIQSIPCSGPGVFIIQMGITLNSSDASITKISLKPTIGGVIKYIGDGATYSVEFYPDGTGHLLAGSGSAIFQTTVDDNLSIQYEITGNNGATFNYSGYIGAVRVA